MRRPLLSTRNSSGKGAGYPRTVLLLLGLISVVALVIVGCSGAGDSSRSGGQKEPPQTTGGKSQAQKATATTGEESQASTGGPPGHPVLGDKNAPVTMIEYGDYQ